MTLAIGGDMQTRREFVRGAAAAGGAGLLGLGPCAASADPPPETSKLCTRRHESRKPGSPRIFSARSLAFSPNNPSAC